MGNLERASLSKRQAHSESLALIGARGGDRDAITPAPTCCGVYDRFDACMERVRRRVVGARAARSGGGSSMPRMRTAARWRFWRSCSWTLTYKFQGNTASSSPHTPSTRSDKTQGRRSSQVPTSFLLPRTYQLLLLLPASPLRHLPTSSFGRARAPPRRPRLSLRHAAN